MAFREVTMIEVKEVLRQWIAGTPKKRIAARLSCDPKTVRRYIKVGQEFGLSEKSAATELTDALMQKIFSSAKPQQLAAKGEGWQKCEAHREVIEDKIKEKVGLVKIRRLLKRKGIEVSYSTLHRFATTELGFGRHSTSTPVAEGEPGSELQVDTGWVIRLNPDINGHRRRVKAWIFTAAVSRHRFVYPVAKETTQSAIEACEAAWEFYGGVFKILIPDNTKAIVQKADPIDPLFNETFLEYSQSRDFVIDSARVRKPKDKARVERAVRHVREDCFGGENLATIAQSRARAIYWSKEEYGLRSHSTTGRMPKEHFESDELPHLLPAPTELYDIPTRYEPKVGADQFAAVEKSLYSLPVTYRGHRLKARADSQTVRFYDKRGHLIKTHIRAEPGKRVFDPADFAPEKLAYAQRDVDFWERQATEHGEQIGRYAHEILSGPLPWTRMRRVRALLSLTKKYGDERVEDACRIALAGEMIDVKRLQRMIEIAAKPAPEPTKTADIIPIARYLRDPSQYKLPRASRNAENQGEEK